MLTDLHLHSLASDGELEPAALVEHAAAHGIKRLSITDHDTLAGYRRGQGAVFEAARRCGVELVVGIEIDALLDGRELHLLGYGLHPEAAALGAHLAAVGEARRERAGRELALVNERFGTGVLRHDEVFVEGRDTLMRPHLIRPLQERGLFASYRAGQDWFRHNANTGVCVPKPEIARAIALVHEAGGWAVLAHPGYYWKEGFPLQERLPGLRAAGLDGLELDYPYAVSSPELFPDHAETRRFTESLREAGEKLGLRLTRGSDAHSGPDLDRIYGPVR